MRGISCDYTRNQFAKPRLNWPGFNREDCIIVLLLISMLNWNPIELFGYSRNIILDLNKFSRIQPSNSNSEVKKHFE